MEVNKIYLGNTLDVLKTFPDESINCCVTSPPYWALRDYGTDGVVWDGDADCEHEFELETKEKISQDFTKLHIWSEDGRDRHAGDKTVIIKSIISNGFCNKCGAWKGQLGLEPDFNLYIKHLCDIFDEVKRVLRKDGTCWVNLGDTYNNSANGGKLASDKSGLCSGKGRNPKLDNSNFVYRNLQDLPNKSLCNIPSRFSIEMQNRGWILRNKIIWHKPNCMPSSVTDRFTVDFEEIFFFVKNKKYWFEQQLEPWQDNNQNDINRAINGHKKYNGKFKDEDKKGSFAFSESKVAGDPRKGRNKRTVWKIPTQPFPGAHFAVFPEKLVETPIKAGCPKDGVVLDPFMGSGTVALKSLKENRNFIGIEINPDYIDMAYNRIRPLLSQSKLFEEELICRV